MIQKLKYISSLDLIYATCAVIVLNTFFYFEGGAKESIIKLGVMGIAPIIFILRTPSISLAVITGLGYWIWCYFSSLFTGEQRFSTLGFLGMYVITFVVYYNLLHQGVFSFAYFKRLLRFLIMAFGVVLVMQQICMLLGIYNMPIANLHNQYFLSIDKLHSLTLEPSHSARVLAVLSLCYWRMYELECGQRPTLRELLNGEMRWPTILFLWSMLTMGSGTAFVALGLLSLYFITRHTVIYVIPFLCLMFVAAESLELTQYERAKKLAEASLTGDVKKMDEAEGSGSARAKPIVNTLTKTDLFVLDTWVGHGTAKIDPRWWKRNNQKLGVIEQYGMIGFIISMFFIYYCVIRRFFSIETLIFLFLFGMSVGNVYYVWGCYMLFAGVRCFQELEEREQSDLITEEDTPADE